MSAQVIQQPLNEAQIEILKLFSSGLTPVQFQEFRQLLITFRFKLLDQQVENVVAKKNISDETIEKASFEHLRTPYRRKIAAKTTLPHEDFKKIQGISLETESLLYKSGILTYLQLAQCPVNILLALLPQGDARFEKQHLTHWIAQAELAAAGQWSELTKLQTSL